MFARLLTIGLIALAPAARAQEDAVFGKKTITIYVGNTAGGNYDLMARLTSRHLGKHIPGRPAIVVENMPGAGSLRAANFIYGAAAKDGTALGIVSENVALEQALKNSAVQYDTRKVTWIGRVATSGAIHMMWHTSKVQSLEDAKKYESPLAGTGAGNLAEVIPTLLNALMGTKFKLVRGYPAANEALLAMERGEVEGASSNWLTIKHGRPDWVREKKIKVILQDQTTRSSDLPDTPALGELGDTPEAKQLFGLYASTGVIGRSFFAPPGVPALNAKILRDAFAAMAKDAEFIADAQKIGAELEIAFHEDIEREVAKTLDAPASAIERAQAIFKQ
jgi:tripartite-type tricarboxylate transporter receptor subunit TctC